MFQYKISIVISDLSNWSLTKLIWSGGEERLRQSMLFLAGELLLLPRGVVGRRGRGRADCRGGWRGVPLPSLGEEEIMRRSWRLRDERGSPLRWRKWEEMIKWEMKIGERRKSYRRERWWRRQASKRRLALHRHLVQLLLVGDYLEIKI